MFLLFYLTKSVLPYNSANGRKVLTGPQPVLIWAPRNGNPSKEVPLLQTSTCSGDSIVSAGKDLAEVKPSGEFGPALGEQLLKNGTVTPVLILTVAT